MLTLTNLFDKRLHAHQQKCLKYAKYAFNDHMVLVLLILFSILGYSYAQFLRQFDATPWQTNELIWIVWCIFGGITTTLGVLPTFVQEADSHFLSVLESDWQPYFKKARYRHFIFTGLIGVCLWAIAYPLYYQLAYSPMSLVACIVLKYADSLKKEYRLQHSTNLYQSLVSFILVSLICGISYMQPIWGTVAAVFYTVSWQHLLTTKRQLYRWNFIIEQEANRTNRLYRLLNLFVEVPFVHPSTKRRTYLDGLLSDKPTAFTFLLERVFFRSPHYLGLWCRLLIVGLTSTIFLPVPDVFALVVITISGLTSVQLIGLYHHYDNHLLLQISPITQEEKKRAYMKSLNKILLMQALVLCCVALIVVPVPYIIVGMASEILFLIVNSLYTQQKIDKMNR